MGVGGWVYFTSQVSSEGFLGGPVGQATGAHGSVGEGERGRFCHRERREGGAPDETEENRVGGRGGAEERADGETCGCGSSLSSFVSANAPSTRASLGASGSG